MGQGADGSSGVSLNTMPQGDGRGAEHNAVTLRKSCDLCVRLKRACDGKNPCHLCSRRREICTRSVKRKSGPAKGTKYTTRRQRLEAGIPDPPRNKRKTSKPREKVDSGGTGAADKSKRGPAGVGHSGVAVTAVLAKGGSRNKSAHGGLTRPPKTHVDSPTHDRKPPLIAGGAGARQTLPPRAHTATAPAESHSARGSLSPRVPPFQSDGSAEAAPNKGGRLYDDSGAGGGGDSGVGGSNLDGVPRRSMSPLSLPVLPWPSPSLAPTTAAPAAGTAVSGPLDVNGEEFGRGRSASPFGLLTGPPHGLAGRPRRGGTREPPVEAHSGQGHFRAPLGAPSSKRFRMSPPFTARDGGGVVQRMGDEGGLEMPYSSQVISPEDAGLRAIRRDPRNPNGTSNYAGGGHTFAGGYAYETTSKVGSFDSSNALGAMMDGRRGGRGANSYRGRDTRMPANGHREVHGDYDDAPSSYSRQHDWNHTGGRFLPHPAPGTSAARRSPAERDRLWRQPQLAHQHQQQLGATFPGSGDVPEPSRDPLAESAAACARESGWGVNAPSKRTVLISHGEGDDVESAAYHPRSWGVVHPGSGGGGGGGGAASAPNHSSDARDSWGFAAGASMPGGRRGLVADGSESGGSDMGAVGLDTSGGVPAGRGSSSGANGANGRGAGGVWTEDTIVLPASPPSPAAKASLLKQQQQQQQRGHQFQGPHDRFVPMLLPPASGTDSTGSGGGGSPFMSATPYRGGSMTSTMDNLRAAQAPSPLWPHANGPANQLHEPRHSHDEDSWSAHMYGERGQSTGTGSSNPAGNHSSTDMRGREVRAVGGGTWQGTWGAATGRRGGLEREGGWPSEYSI